MRNPRARSARLRAAERTAAPALGAPEPAAAGKEGGAHDQSRHAYFG